MSEGARLTFEQLDVGKAWDSATRQVTDRDVLAFADLTGDRNPVHLDATFALQTPFRRCIAHGLLGLSFAAGLLQDSPPVHTVAFLGLQEWRFLAPMFPGDTIRVRCRVEGKSLRGRGRRGRVTWRLQVRNQDDRVLQEGITETLVEAGHSRAFSSPEPAAEWFATKIHSTPEGGRHAALDAIDK